MIRPIVWPIAAVAALAAMAYAADRAERGALVTENVPEPPPEIRKAMRAYLETRSASFQGWLAGGNHMLISTRFGETAQIHRVDHPGGARRQLTFFEEPVTEAWPCPNAENPCFIFARDEGGSENGQLYLYDFETGAITLVTDGRARNGGVVWSNAGDRFAFHSTLRNGKDFDIYVGMLGEPVEIEPVLQAGGAWRTLDWSPDGDQLLLTRYVSINESYLYRLNLQNRRLSQINPSDAVIAYREAKWSGDGKGIYLISDEDGEFQTLRYLDIETGKQTILTESLKWDVTGLDVSRDGRWLAYTANQNGFGRLRVRNLGTGGELDLDSLPEGVYGPAFGPGNKQIAFTVRDSQIPGDVFVLELESGDTVRWTHSETGGLPPSDFIRPELIHYPTFDQVGNQPRVIPAFYYKPKGGGPFPSLIHIHGGPESQFRPVFNPFIQYVVNELGMAVIAPNVRGSSGYGKTYLKLDNERLREDSVKDIGALLNWIDGQNALDADRVAVMGGSYGGYMTLASMIRYNERLRAGIEIVGIANFVTFLENTMGYRRELRRMEYGNESDPEMREFLTAISPVTNAGGITKPLLVAQGLNDPRVPAGESEQIVEAIRQNGGEVWYILARDEGHGFAKQSNREFYYSAAALFLKTHALEKIETAAPEEIPAQPAESVQPPPNPR